MKFQIDCPFSLLIGSEVEIGKVLKERKKTPDIYLYILSVSGATESRLCFFAPVTAEEMTGFLVLFKDVRLDSLSYMA